MQMDMQDAPATADWMQPILRSATQRSRRLAIIGFLGIASVIISLVTLYLLAEHRARLAQQQELVARDNAQSIAIQLEKVRAAYAARDFTKVGVELGITVATTEKLEASPDALIASNPVDLSQHEALAIADQNPVYTIPPNTDNFQQKVYIQFPGSLNRAQISALNQALRKAGWAVQGQSGEYIDSAAGLNEVRYSGTNDKAAEALAAAITAANLTSRPVKTHKMDIIGANILEAWISN